MFKKLLFTIISIGLLLPVSAQFATTFTQWNIPDLGEFEDDQISNINFGLIDMNGDGKLDLVDAEDNNTGTVWIAGSDKYWRVYLNDGTKFATTFTQWIIPDLGEFSDDQISDVNFGLIDMNGDGIVDLVDAEDNNTGNVWIAGSDKYWRVYLNDGTKFATTFTQWLIPDLGELDDDQISNANYALVDMNGDGIVDLVDTEDNNTGNVWIAGSDKYWRVFLNDGTKFATTFTQWLIPDLGEIDDDQISNINYGLIDMNGDGKLDLVDAEDNNTGNVWIAGSDKYWRVFLNDGTKFATTFTQWIIPDLGEVNDDQISNANYGLVDMNADGILDLVDAEDNNTGNVWIANGDKYWRVFLNDSTKFATTFTQWIIPDLGETDDDQISNANYGLIDMNGDGKIDLVDAEDNNSGTVWIAGSDKYWRVFKNLTIVDTPSTAISDLNFSTLDLVVYPNPASKELTINIPTMQDCAFQLFDVSGKLLQSKELKMVEKYTLSLNGLSNGAYFLKLITAEQVYQSTVYLNR